MDLFFLQVSTHDTEILTLKYLDYLERCYNSYNTNLKWGQKDYPYIVVSIFGKWEFSWVVQKRGSGAQELCCRHTHQGLLRLRLKQQQLRTIDDNVIAEGSSRETHRAVGCPQLATKLECSPRIKLLLSTSIQYLEISHSV